MSGTDAEEGDGGAHGGGGRTDASEREIPVHATSDDGGGGTAALRSSRAPGRKNKTEYGQSKLPEF